MTDASKQRPWIAVATASVVVAAVAVVAAINGSWGFVAFLVLVSAMFASQFGLWIAERNGRLSHRLRLGLRQLIVLLFAIGAVLLGRAAGN